METFVPRYKILSLEDDLDGNATEAERCQQLLVEMEAAWDGIEGARPPGTYAYAIIALRNEVGWQLERSTRSLFVMLAPDMRRALRRGRNK